MRSAGRARKEAADISRAEENVQALQEQLRELEARVESEIEAIRQQTGASIDSLESICIKPKKANIQVRLLTLAWAPYTRDEAGQLMTPAWE